MDTRTPTVVRAWRDNWGKLHYSYKDAARENHRKTLSSFFQREDGAMSQVAMVNKILDNASELLPILKDIIDDQQKGG